MKRNSVFARILVRQPVIFTRRPVLVVRSHFWSLEATVPGGDELDLPCSRPAEAAPRLPGPTRTPVSPPQRAPCPTRRRAPEAPDNPRLTKLCVSRRRSGARASGNVWGSRLLIQWPLTTLLVYNLELCAEAHRLPPRLLWIALDVCGGGTRSQWSVLTAEGCSPPPSALSLCFLLRCGLDSVVISCSYI